MKIFGIIFKLVILFLLLNGCGDFYPPSEPFTMDEVPGIFQATFGNKKEYILLNPDSTFVHVWYSDSIEKKEEGTWNIQERSSEYKGYYDINFSSNFTITWKIKGIDSNLKNKSDHIKWIGLTFKKRNDILEIVIHPLQNLLYQKIAK